MFRATGCQGERTDGRAPLLIQERDSAFASGVVTRFREGPEPLATRVATGP